MSFTAFSNWFQRDETTEKFLHAVKAGDLEATITALTRQPNFFAVVGEYNQSCLQKALQHIFVLPAGETRSSLLTEIMINLQIQYGMDRGYQKLFETLIQASSFNQANLEEIFTVLDTQTINWIALSEITKQNLIGIHQQTLEYYFAFGEICAPDYQKAEQVLEYLRSKEVELHIDNENENNISFNTLSTVPQDTPPVLVLNPSGSFSFAFAERSLKQNIPATSSSAPSFEFPA